MPDQLAKARKAARLKGELRYYTGLPCIRGHIAERMVSTGRCLECRPPSAGKGREYNARWKAKHPGREQEAKYRYRYGVELSALPPKPDTCDVCGRGGKISLDHDHASGGFRGWLCDPCNVALGLVRDDAELLRKLASYLEEKAQQIKDVGTQTNGVSKGAIRQSRWRVERQALSRSTEA